jgi:FkbM family methyltransferase
MHKGEDTDYYLQKGFRVVAFEANPELAKLCRTRFANAIDQKDLIIIEGAIVEQNPQAGAQKTVKFYRNREKSIWGTVNSDWADRNEILRTDSEIIEIEVVDFKECLREFGIPYYMKIDIEGSDNVCLQSLLDFDIKPNYVSIESEKVVFSMLEEQIDLLLQLGYGQFKSVQQETIVHQVSPDPAKEGKTTNYQFQYGSSGLFGEDLPGEWKTKRSILKEYKKVFLLYRLFGDYSALRRFALGRKLIQVLRRVLRKPLPGWHDIHAKQSPSVL